MEIIEVMMLRKIPGSESVTEINGSTTFQESFINRFTLNNSSIVITFHFVLDL